MYIFVIKFSASFVISYETVKISVYHFKKFNHIFMLVKFCT